MPGAAELVFLWSRLSAGFVGGSLGNDRSYKVIREIFRFQFLRTYFLFW